MGGWSRGEVSLAAVAVMIAAGCGLVALQMAFFLRSDLATALFMGTLSATPAWPRLGRCWGRFAWSFACPWPRRGWRR